MLIVFVIRIGMFDILRIFVTTCVWVVCQLHRHSLLFPAHLSETLGSLS